MNRTPDLVGPSSRILVSPYDFILAPYPARLILILGV
jgi:hypothetical protein